MSMIETIVAGTLKPDGTLELDQKPNMAPGRVAVRMQPLPAAPLNIPVGDPFFDMLREIWATRAAAGLVPRSVEEVEAQRRQMRDDMEQEILEAGRLQEESQRLREQSQSSTGDGK